jgi:hypothetical protein
MRAMAELRNLKAALLDQYRRTLCQQLRLKWVIAIFEACEAIMKSVLFFIVGALAASITSAHVQAAAPCALVCFPPAVLDAKKCTCEAQSSGKSKLCDLVCLGPEETLDPKQCLCVKADKKSGSKSKKSRAPL